MSLNFTLQSDVDRIVKRLAKDAEFFRGQSVLVTGGTGFFGKWLVWSLDELNRTYDLGMTIAVLSRNPTRLADELPNLAHIILHRGDVLDLADLPAYSIVIHAATTASEKLNRENPREMFDTAFDGTRKMLDWARAHETKHFLFASSGAVYGRQPQAVSHVPEDYMGGPDVTDPRSAYGEAKRAGEHAGVLSSADGRMRFLIARCFAFVGPFLPLDTHFAVGNFLLNGSRDENFVIRGDGTPRRSYMYTEDLVVWLLTILARGTSGRAYNVGSDESVSIRETAEAARRAWSSAGEIQVLTPVVDPTKYEQYVPSVERAKSELGLRLEVPISEGLARMVTWLSSDKR